LILGISHESCGFKAPSLIESEKYIDHDGTSDRKN
jgi:hypothetical protein